MNWLKKMDEVLGTLYENSGVNPTFPFIEEKLKGKGIAKGEIQDILLYLYREKYIYCEFGGNRDHQYVEYPDAHYLINCKGKLFWEGTGGFFSQDEKEKIAHSNSAADVSIRKYNEKRVAVGTIWLAVGTLMLVFVEVLIHWKDISTLLRGQ